MSRNWQSGRGDYFRSERGFHHSNPSRGYGQEHPSNEQLSHSNHLTRSSSWRGRDQSNADGRLPQRGYEPVNRQFHQQKSWENSSGYQHEYASESVDRSLPYDDSRDENLSRWQSSASFRGNESPRSDGPDDGKYSRRRHDRSRSPRGYQGHHYRDRDAEYRDHPSNYGGREQKRRRLSDEPFRFGGPPNKEVMIDGLVKGMTTELIRDEIQSRYNYLLFDVRIFRNTNIAGNQGYGFLTFADIDTATKFLEQNHPIIKLHDASGQEVHITIAYARKKRDNRDSIPLVMNQPRRPSFQNDGEQDKSDDAQAISSPFLLVRLLQPKVTEAILSKGILKLCKGEDSPAQETTKKPVSKLTSTTASTELGAPEGSLFRVLLIRDRITGTSQRFGFAQFHTAEDAKAAYAKYLDFKSFTIASKPVEVSGCHSGVFLPPELAAIPPQNTDEWTFVRYSDPSKRYAYWDKDLYAGKLALTEPLPPEQPGAVEETATEESGSKKKKKKSEEDHTTEVNTGFVQAFSVWNKKRAELEEINGEERSFRHPKKNACLLCSQMFDAPEKVARHEKLSKIHAENLKNEELIAKTRDRIVKLGGTLPEKKTAESDQYRDRAAERRAADGVPEKFSGFKMPAAGQPKTNKAATSAATIDPPVGKAGPSIGEKMMIKMGHAPGAGLGASGGGSTAPLATAMYKPGAGLGTEGGKMGDALEEAGRATRGRADEYAAAAMESARRRYEGTEEK